jgi:hypothetical protein
MVGNAGRISSKSIRMASSIDLMTFRQGRIRGAGAESIIPPYQFGVETSRCRSFSEPHECWRWRNHKPVYADFKKEMWVQTSPAVSARQMRRFWSSGLLTGSYPARGGISPVKSGCGKCWVMKKGVPREGSIPSRRLSARALTLYFPQRCFCIGSGWPTMSKVTLN